MTVYVDSEYRCFAAEAEGLTAVEDAFFDGKCKRFIEGYMCKPIENSVMITPFVDYALLAAYQEQYEENLAALNAAYSEGVNSI